jgi:hypothetical protein
MVPGYEMWSGEIDPTAYPDEPPVLHRVGLEDRIPADQVDLSTPEAVARALFRALSQQDSELLEWLLMTPRDYAATARTSLSTAEDHMAEVAAETRAVFQTFAGEVPSEQRPGGLGSMLDIDSVSVGAGRLASGELADDDEPSVMVWGTEVRMRLHDSDQVFRLRMPKLLVTPDGQWRLAEAPRIGGMLQLFIDMGFHLSPTLLAFEHYPLPLQTGNYWTYQVRVEEGEWDADARRRHRPRSEGDAAGTGQPAEPGLLTFRDDVVARQDYDAYALVRIRRRYDDPDQSTDRIDLLLTPRRVYRCNRDCRRRIEDVSWLLAHLSRRVPELIFPLRPGVAWRTGGRLDLDGEYQTRHDYEVADVPAGHFEHSVCITRSITEGREHRYFVPGIGIVLTHIDTPTESRFYELVDYRIMP